MEENSSFTLSNMLIKIRQNKDIFKDAYIKNINCYKCLKGCIWLKDDIHQEIKDIRRRNQ